MNYTYFKCPFTNFWQSIQQCNQNFSQDLCKLYPHTYLSPSFQSISPTPPSGWISTLMFFPHYTLVATYIYILEPRDLVNFETETTKAEGWFRMTDARFLKSASPKKAKRTPIKTVKINLFRTLEITKGLYLSKRHLFKIK